jgi:hypothetical protein
MTLLKVGGMGVDVGDARVVVVVVVVVTLMEHAC